MTGLEVCPACLRLARGLVEQALDFTGSVTRGQMRRLCEQHLPLVFSTLGYRTMARWLDSMIALRESDRATFDAMACPLCTAEAEFTPTAEELQNAYLCQVHGGGGAEALAHIREQLARIVDGERFDQQRFVIRAALVFYASIRGSAPFVRIE